MQPDRRTPVVRIADEPAAALAAIRRAQRLSKAFMFFYAAASFYLFFQLRDSEHLKGLSLEISIGFLIVFLIPLIVFIFIPVLVNASILWGSEKLTRSSLISSFSYGIFFALMSPFVAIVLLRFSVIYPPLYVDSLVTLVVFVAIAAVYWKCFKYIRLLRKKEELTDSCGLEDKGKICPILEKLLTIPSIFFQLKNKQLIVASIYLLSSLLESLSISSLLLWTYITGIFLRQHLSMCGRDFECWNQFEAFDFARQVAQFSLIFASMLVSNTIRRLGERLVVASYSEIERLSDVRPILFLRSFADDNVMLKKDSSGVAGWWLSLGWRRTSLDRLLVSEFGDWAGPVVALGNPRDRLPPFGAIRRYTEHDRWQHAIHDLCAAADVIVICVDETPGLAWELRYVVRHNLLDKTLVIFPPKARADLSRVLAIPEVAAIIDDWHTLDSGRHRPLDPNVIAVYRSRAGRPVIVRCWEETYEAYVIAVRVFLYDRAVGPAAPTAAPPGPDSTRTVDRSHGIA